MNGKAGKDEENGVFPFDGRSSNSKLKEISQSDFSQIMWPVTPLKKLKRDPLFLINEGEFPEESDDEDYRPGPEELQDPSEEDTGRQSVISNISQTSPLDLSASQYVDNFDSNLLNDNPGNQPIDDVFEVPDESIGQRTRSKLSLSSTPLELIEEAFIPPDITTDMYDFKCDNEDWENFLKEFMQPLTNANNDPDDDDDEADPDYNVLAGEEEVANEELRRDRDVKIPRKELRKLVAELFESRDEYSSDEEEENRVRTEITNRVQSDMKKKAAEKDNEKKADSEKTVALITFPQRLLLEQQLRQHIQLTTQHFIQTCQHPLYEIYAKESKIIVSSLVGLAEANNKSVFNSYNLRPAYSLMEEWEKYLASKEGQDVISHMEKEVTASKEAKRKNHFHRVSLHPSMMKFMIESNVFMYPLLLPPLGFRCDGPFKVEFILPEDSLLAIGLEEFTEHVLANPRWLNNRKNYLRMVVDLICRYILVTKKPFQVCRHYRNVKNVESNPVYHYCKNKTAPRTVHYVIPFNDNLTKPPKDQFVHFLPPNFQEYLNDQGDKNNK